MDVTNSEQSWKEIAASYGVSIGTAGVARWSTPTHRSTSMNLLAISMRASDENLIGLAAAIMHVVETMEREE